MPANLGEAELQRFISSARELYEIAYNRGVQDCLQKIVGAVSNSIDGAVDVVAEPAMAPQLSGPASALLMRGTRSRRGLALELITRALSAGPAEGLTTAQIKAGARTPEERALSMGAIRYQLRLGEKEGTLACRDGRWRLVAQKSASA